MIGRQSQKKLQGELFYDPNLDEVSYTLRLALERDDQRQRQLTWLRSIRNAREEIEWRLQRSPSLRPRLPEFLAWAYPRARKAAAEETRLPLATFPDTCPCTLEQLQDDEFLPLLKP